MIVRRRISVNRFPLTVALQLREWIQIPDFLQCVHDFVRARRHGAVLFHVTSAALVTICPDSEILLFHVELRDRAIDHRNQIRRGIHQERVLTTIHRDEDLRLIFLK